MGIQWDLFFTVVCLSWMLWFRKYASILLSAGRSLEVMVDVSNIFVSPAAFMKWSTSNNVHASKKREFWGSYHQIERADSLFDGFSVYPLELLKLDVSKRGGRKGRLLPGFKDWRWGVVEFRLWVYQLRGRWSTIRWAFNLVCISLQLLKRRSYIVESSLGGSVRAKIARMIELNVFIQLFCIAYNQLAS